MLDNAKKHPDWCKVCVGWRNMFPEKFTEERTNPHMVLNATGWNNEASEIWQHGNNPVKTFCLTVYNFDWADKYGQHRTHNPFVIGCDAPGYTANGECIHQSYQMKPTPTDSPLILYHYQFKCNKEWVMKCTKRISPGAKNFAKNYPDKYAKLYTGHHINHDMRMVELWNG